MLRSSRQGRKIAARYHALPSNVKAADLNDSTSITSFYRRLTPTHERAKAHSSTSAAAAAGRLATTNMHYDEDDSVNNANAARMSLSSSEPSRSRKKVDVYVQQPSPVKQSNVVEALNGDEKRRRPSQLMALAPSSSSSYTFEATQTLTMPHTPSLSEGATSAASTAMTMEWSRETSIESASLRESSASNSSPPPPLPLKSPKVAKIINVASGQREDDWHGHDDDDDLSSTLSSLTDGPVADAEEQRIKAGLDEDLDHSYDTSLIAGRPRRTLSKTIKQLEAEESLSLTPKKRRAVRSDTSPRSQGSLSQPRTPQRKRHHDDDEQGTPSPMFGTPESSVLSDAPADFELYSPPPLRSQTDDLVDVPVRKRGRKKGSKNVRNTSVASLGDGETSEALDSRTAAALRAQKPLWKRKVFLTSGLYSDDHKVSETVKAPTRKSFLSSQKDRLHNGTERTRAIVRKSAFPMPTDFGYWVLTEQRDFRLPFPIAEEIGEIREKMASKRKPPPYKHISQNRYYSRPKLPGEIMVCQCPPTGTCDESCMNRQTQYLCHPKLCPCGDRCTNIQFGKRKPVKTEAHWYGARGFGLRTLEPIAKDSFIDEYRGEVISYNEMVRRVRDHYKDTGNYYFLMYDAPAGEMLDGGLKGNITRYANHSCDPNCKIQKWLVCGTDEQCAGEFQVALYAGRDIAAGEELTYDYGWSAFSPKAVTGGDGDVDGGEACHCGAANCSGVMGRKGTSSSSSATASNTAAAMRSGRSTRKRKYKKRLAVRKQRELAQAKLQDVAAAANSMLKRAIAGSSASTTTSVVSPTLAPSAEQTNAAAPPPPPSSAPSSTSKAQKIRTYVRDRVSFGARPAPKQLIDSDNVPIIEGKRARKSSTSSFADLQFSESQPRKRARHSNPFPLSSNSAAKTLMRPLTGADGLSQMSSSVSMSDVSFDMSKYPPGTKFYQRNGDEFDFATLTLKRRGKKPRPYTREELEEANERHRVNLKRLNDLRKFK